MNISNQTLDLENIDFGCESRALAPNLRLLAAKSSQKNKKRNRIKLDVKIVIGNLKAYHLTEFFFVDYDCFSM